MGSVFWPGVASQPQHGQGWGQRGLGHMGRWTWKAKGFRQVMVMVERSDFRKRGFKEEELLRADSALIIHSEIWGGAGGCLAHAPGICCQAAERGCDHGRARQGRQRKWRYTTREEEESHNWLPAEDDFQLAAVELPSVRQAHDALLVARQVLHVHLLNKGKGVWLSKVSLKWIHSLILDYELS